MHRMLIAAEGVVDHVGLERAARVAFGSVQVDDGGTALRVTYMNTTS